MIGSVRAARGAAAFVALLLAVGGLVAAFVVWRATAAPPSVESASPQVTPTLTGPSGGAGTSSTKPATKPSGPAAATTPSAGASSTPVGASLAGRIKPGVVRHGVATFYDTNGGGACLYDPSPDTMTAAMNWADYEQAKACGAYVRVRGANGATVTVRITNECPPACRVGQLDLSPQAYAKLAPLKTGETPITWTLISPELPGTIAVRYKTGSSQWWCAIQVVGHRNPVARLEVRVGSAWRTLPRTAYNYFVSARGAGCGASIRVTDIYAQTLVIKALPVKSDVLQRTDLQFAKH